MALTPEQAVAAAVELKKVQDAERTTLDEVRRYWTGRQKLPSVVPAQAPRPVKEMARMARVNIVDLVVESLAQSLFVEGFRSSSEQENSEVWGIWQANKWDARQSGVHRAALAYGTSYTIVLDGDPQPVLRGVSPRKMAAGYGDDPDWPVQALEKRGPKAYRLYDESSVYELALEGDTFKYVETKEHSAGVTPVIRYREVEDLDADDEPSDLSASGLGRATPRPTAGQIGPLMALQDQVDAITFNLLVAQHYGAFRQRYIIGWLATDEQEKAKASAAALWTFENENVKAGEFAESNLEGYINSREASLRHMASLSQTPAHELVGELVNLSADAIAAAEAGRNRKVADRQTTLGESHEQMLGLAGSLAAIEVPEDGQVRWRDTTSRSLAALADALGKLASQLKIPPEELWERIPGVTQQDIERWRKAAAAAPPDASAQPPDREDAEPAPPEPGTQA